MTTSGSTVPGGVTDKIRAFYEANPDEELSVDDIVLKFDCTKRQAYHAIATLGLTYAPRMVRACPA